jgi:tetratricopeptide (TPR) repeat protein
MMRPHVNRNSAVQTQLFLILKRIKLRGTVIDIYATEMKRLIDERNVEVAQALWKHITEKRILLRNHLHLEILNKVLSSGIPSLYNIAVYNVITHKIPFEVEEELLCKIIHLCGKNKNWNSAKLVFERAKKLTPNLKNALACAYLDAGKIDLVSLEDLKLNPDKGSLYINLMKYSTAMGNYKEALRYLENSKSLLDLETYYSHKTEIMIRFSLFDELDEVFNSIRKDAFSFKKFVLNSLLEHYQNSRKNDHKEKLEFLLSLRNRLDGRTSSKMGFLVSLVNRNVSQNDTPIQDKVVNIFNYDDFI